MRSYYTVREWMKNAAIRFVKENRDAIVAEWKAFVVSKLNRGGISGDAARYNSFCYFYETVDPDFERITAETFRELDEGCFDDDEEGKNALFAPESAEDLAEILSDLASDPDFKNDFAAMDAAARFKFWGKAVCSYYGCLAVFDAGFELEREGVLPSSYDIYKEALKEARGGQAA